ncbi:starch phosphorylase [Paracoccus pantotrophus]|uniref:Alpha-1,4 glucan phosphorylase n=1 Tax=Paracoccus pantotrophus TaxID=82367 RepID=A0AAE6NTV7_PARPN|nr:glycogen/starch/alpha-glucan phosphorylase [Paracoccus pantotrophus]QFG35075.1 glycogen/starch/alpha-glucan phosphorylase [Paracoccus pantotrophus]RKS44747.1 starch phosphorylase [Paracoccus pantotrophus]
MARDDMPQSDFRDAILWHLTYTLGKDPDHAQLFDWRLALSHAVRDRIVDRWMASTRATYRADAKRVYYLSMEFLIGRLLQDNIVNLQLADEAQEAVESFGLDWRGVLLDEPDAALGNGGLGRLAACFMESLATLGCPAYGYGIRYEHGLFRQSFAEGRQMESPEDWLEQPFVWQFERPEARFVLGLGGRVATRDGRAVWEPESFVQSEAYDIPVIGWRGAWANTLRLWAGRAVDPFDLARFNAGDFAAAAEAEALARTISRVLYPEDSTEKGKRLRLTQEYFFSAASIRDILRRFEAEHADLRLLPQKVAIQLNDTHPAIAGPELLRILHDERGLPFDEALAITRACVNYTNHTLLPEALESWGEGLFGDLLPRHLQIIDRIDAEDARAHPDRRNTARGDGKVRMGELSFILSNRVNGVSALHTGLMKTTVFADQHRIWPDRIVNQTNGVTPRRWLLGCNPRLARLITRTIGDGWVGDLEQLQALEPHVADAGWLEEFAAVKAANKADLSGWIARDHGVMLDPQALFDVQIKRIHEYKRQHLNILEAIALWQEMRENPSADWTARVKIFGGKAAPGYFFAKDIIRLINDVAAVINADAATKEKLQILYLPNYNVTLAERLIPAADLSEQISTAGKEASGTGNMKFALNGAPTIGTLDGANVEIRELVGPENFFLFGLTAEEAEARRAVPDHAACAVAADPRLKRAVEAIRSGAFSPGEPDRYANIVENLTGADYFLVASDFADYWRAQREVDFAYANRAEWTRMAALNVARSGWFSSDRTIRGYMQDIWNVKSLLGQE